MKSTSRIFLHCMFCGREETTKEHIFGKKISQNFEPRPYGVKRFRHNVPPDALPKSEARKFWRRGGDHLLAVTSSSMCSGCNHLLGRELTPLSALITKIYKGETNVVPARYTCSFLRYFQRIGILVDLETAVFDPATMRQSEDDTNFNRNYHGCPPMLSREERGMFLSGAIIPEVKVYAGRQHGLHGRDYRMNVAFLRTEDRKEQAYKAITFSVDRFTCLIALGFYPNMNPKLREVTLNGCDFVLDRHLISTDADVELNYAPLETYPEDPDVARIAFAFWPQWRAFDRA